MANPRYNQQVTNRRGAMNGGRMKKMGGGMMKRKMLKSGSKPDFLDLDKDKNRTESMKSAAKSMKKNPMMKADKTEQKAMKSGVSKLNKGLRKFLAKKGNK
jgi:hypothetical protein|tara:strand:- start:224 stop:526 length:303 start_codon:yes stop_codon:yes gene_type:complete